MAGLLQAVRQAGTVLACAATAAWQSGAVVRPPDQEEDPIHAVFRK